MSYRDGGRAAAAARRLTSSSEPPYSSRRTPRHQTRSEGMRPDAGVRPECGAVIFDEGARTRKDVAGNYFGISVKQKTWRMGLELKRATVGSAAASAKKALHPSNLAEGDSVGGRGGAAVVFRLLARKLEAGLPSKLSPASSFEEKTAKEFLALNQALCTGWAGGTGQLPQDEKAEEVFTTYRVLERKAGCRFAASLRDGERRDPNHIFWIRAAAGFAWSAGGGPAWRKSSEDRNCKGGAEGRTTPKRCFLRYFRNPVRPDSAAKCLWAKAGDGRC